MVTGLSMRIQSAENGYIIYGDGLENPRIYQTDIEVIRFVERFFKMQDVLISQFEPEPSAETASVNK